MFRENKETDQDWVKVEIDPTAVSGQNVIYQLFCAGLPNNLPRCRAL